jgi:ribonuclease HII
VTGREVIDSINILQATLQSMAQAAAALSTPADYLLVDGNRLPQQLPVPAQCVVKGDATCYAIAAASIIAKVRAGERGRLHWRWWA